MANGLAAEQMLLQYLAERGFRLAPKTQAQDQGFHIDAVVLSPPLPEGTQFYPAPIALQITTRVGDHGKRAEFINAAKDIAPRFAYLELGRSASLTKECLYAAEAALIALFCGADAPEAALIYANDNRFNIRNLEEVLEKYRQWISTRIAGILNGELVFWKSAHQYGFVEAKVEGPTGEVETLSFWVHMSGIADMHLRLQLQHTDGQLQTASERIAVTFEDAGQTSEEHGRKTAVHVRRATSASEEQSPTPP